MLSISLADDRLILVPLILEVYLKVLINLNRELSASINTLFLLNFPHNREQRQILELCIGPVKRIPELSFFLLMEFNHVLLLFLLDVLHIHFWYLSQFCGNDIVCFYEITDPDIICLRERWIFWQNNFFCHSRINVQIFRLHLDLIIMGLLVNNG